MFGKGAFTLSVFRDAGITELSPGKNGVYHSHQVPVPREAP